MVNYSLYNNLKQQTHNTTFQYFKHKVSCWQSTSTIAFVRKKLLEYMMLLEKVREDAPWLLTSTNKLKPDRKHRLLLKTTESLYQTSTSNPKHWAMSVAPAFKYGKDKLMESLFQEYKQGGKIEQLQNSVLRVMEKHWCTPFRGLMMTLIANLSFEQYRLVRAAFNNDIKDVLAEIKTTLGTKTIPQIKLLPSAKKTKQQFNEVLADNKANFQEVQTKTGGKGYIWKIPELLEWIYGNPVLLKLMAIDGDPFYPRFIIHDDAFPLGSESKHGYAITVTFENFGEYCKCSSLNFTIAVGDCNDKDVDDIKAMLGENLWWLNLICTVGMVPVKILGNKWLCCDLNKCGDDPLQRLWMGLTGSCQNHMCKYCFAMRSMFFLLQ